MFFMCLLATRLYSRKVLDLSFNQIGDIETLGLGGLVQLKVLHLTSNRIIQVNGLTGFVFIHKIFCKIPSKDFV